MLSPVISALPFTMTSLTSSPVPGEQQEVKDIIAGDSLFWQNDNTGEEWATTKAELYSFYAYYVGNNGLSGFK
jgi:hypothetical protein